MIKFLITVVLGTKLSTKEEVDLIHLLERIVFLPGIYHLGGHWLAKKLINYYTKSTIITKVNGRVDLDSLTQDQFHVCWMRSIAQL